MQLQVLRTYVLSASEYLSGVLTVRASVAAALDAVALNAVRGIFGLPRHTSTALLWGLSGLAPSATLAQRAQLRMLFQLLGTATDSPASRMARALAGEPHSPQSRAGPVPNWVHVAWRLRALWGELGVAVPDAGRARDSHRSCCPSALPCPESQPVVLSTKIVVPRHAAGT
jgi:hypothetical protein